MSMNVLSVKQPHAFLLAIGVKPIENRTWKLPEKYKNERVLIHASGQLSKTHLTDEQYEAASHGRDGIKGRIYCERFKSAIIGSVRFVDCVINHPSIWAEKTMARVDKVFYDPIIHNTKGCIKDFNGDIVQRKDSIFNWLATDPILFDKPILGVKGKLGFWNYPADILICPYCGKICLHDNSDIGVPNWGNPVHECEHCKEMILESEFNILK